MKLLLARSLIYLLSWVPLRLGHALAVPLGWLLDGLPLRKHQVIDTHLALALPDLDPAARRRLRRQHWVEMARLVVELGAVWHWDAERLRAHVQPVEGWDQISRANAAGQGCLVISAHMSNWEVMSLYGSLRQPITYLYKAPHDPRLDALLVRSRERFGGRLVKSGSPAMRDILKTLRAGGNVGLLADQQPKQGDGVFAPLFGVEALTMTLVNRLARHTGCAVLLASGRREPGGRGWSIRVVPADERIRSPDPVEAARCLNQWLENSILEAPAQYLWSYKRYSIRPPGQASVYPG